MKNYINPQRVKTAIMIYLRIVKTWLYKLKYVYKNISKNVFIDKHKQLDVVKDHINFLKKMEELKPYIVEFYNNGIIKPKVYPYDYVVGNKICKSIIIITHDEYIFFANNGVQKV